MWFGVTFHLGLRINFGFTIDKVKDYRTARAKLLQAHASEAPIQLLRRVPPNIPNSVSSTVIVKSESAVTDGGRSMVMLMGTPEGKIADLRKQKDAVMYLRSEYDEDDMSYYAVLFKRTM